jgi:pimeloyl-ACP methyl ester carboxylesterase
MKATQALVLLPGLLCDAALWAAQLEALAGVASPVVADLTRHDSIGAMAEAVLRAAPGRFALAGLSMGGYVAQEVMRRAPERVTRLALLDTSARADTEAQRKRRGDLLALAGRGHFKGVTPRLLPMLVHPARLADEALTASVMAMAERVGPEAFLRQQQAIMARPDSRPDLPRVACPTLVLCGRQDALTRLERPEEMAALIAPAELVVIEDCGHLSTLERPGEVSAALRRWLGR